MYAIARYRVVDYFRRRGRALEREDLRGNLSTGSEFAAEDANAGTPADAPFSEELGAALDAIPERQRQAVLLLKQDDLSVREAAVRMGVSESSLKVLAHRGYKALKSFLSKG
jgi:RNA polymerase sigma-70 factor (ECF subfamily)